MKINTEKHIVLYTKNTIIESLNANAKINLIVTIKNNFDERIKNIINIATKKNTIINYVNTIDELNKISNGQKHQGIIAFLPKEIKNYTIDEIINNKITEPPLIIICNNITDTSNLGNIIRSAEAFGASGIIIQKRKSCSPTNENVFRTSCGAIFNIKICIVSNINFAIDKLKNNNIWIIGSVISNNKKIYSNNINLNMPLAIILGSEDNGMNELTKKKCDFLITIPMFGKMSSINVNNAAAIFLYEIRRQRDFNK